MNTRKRVNCTPRLIGKEELAAYLCLGEVSAIRFAIEAGAARKIGRRCLYDVHKLDEAVDKLPVYEEG